METKSGEELKIIILNYGKWKDAKCMELFLQSKNIIFSKVQKSRQLSFGFIIFETKEQLDVALSQLQGLKWNNEILEAKVAHPKKNFKSQQEVSEIHTKHRQKRKKMEESVVNDEDFTTVAVDIMPENAQDVVTPWANIPYKEQLARKESEMKKVLVKIVRQTRKEYTKKEKRIAQDMRNVARKKRRHQKEAATDHENLGNEVLEITQNSGIHIPSWLASHGNLYVICNDNLYAQAIEEDQSIAWTYVAKAGGINAIVSFGAELVAAREDNSLVVLKMLASGERKWELLCKGPENGTIVSLASIRGTLMCCTNGGEIYAQEGAGQFATGVWKYISSATIDIITTHNGYLVGYSTKTHNWWRARLQDETFATLELNEWTSMFGKVASGLASHNSRLILLNDAESSIDYITDDSKIECKRCIKISDINDEKNTFKCLASHRGLCCPMDPIRPSPDIEGYRNKCEFSIGLDKDGQPCVGFRMGLFREGSVVVSPPGDCINVPSVMKEVCAHFQTLIGLNLQQFSVYDVKTQVGVWRMLTVRYSERTTQLMIVLQYNPSSLSEEECIVFNELVLKSLTQTEDLSFTVTSLYLQPYSGVSSPKESDPIHHVYGSKYIDEILLGKRFAISPQAFFQVNTTGAETLYSLVHNNTKADKNTLLYDVCCGTGTIGICTANGAGKVVGIEICKSATDDAKLNAEANDVLNISFVNAKAEDVMRDLLRAPTPNNEKHLTRAVAIVDPPRGGLHHQVIRALRACPPVERIVYVSCNPTGSLITDAMTFCGPNTKAVQGTAFEVVHAAPVDMFPHTKHCEMVVVFDRVREWAI